MRPSLLQKLLSVCDRGPGGLRSLPDHASLQQRLDSDSAEEILQELVSFPGGIEAFACEYGLLVSSNEEEPEPSLKRPRPSSLAYSQVGSVRSRSVAESQSLGVRQFLRVVNDRSVVEKLRQLGMERPEPIDFEPVRYCNALRAVENLLGTDRSMRAPALAFQRLAKGADEDTHVARKPLCIALLLEEYAFSRLAPYAAMQDEIVLSHLPNVERSLREAPIFTGGLAKRPRSEIAKQAGSKGQPPRERCWDDRIVAPLQSGIRKV